MRQIAIPALIGAAVACIAMMIGRKNEPIEPPAFQTGERIEFRLSTGETINNLDGPSPVMKTRNFIVSPGPEKGSSGSLRPATMRLADGRTVWLVEEERD